MVELGNIYIILLGILAYYDVRHNKNVPDVIVISMYLIGLYESIIRDIFLIFLSATALLYLIHRLGLFGDAEVFVIPPLLIHFGLRGLDLLMIALVSGIAASYSLIFMSVVLIVMLFNPLLSMILSYLGFIIWKDKIKIVERKRVSPELIGEVTVDGRIVDKDFIANNANREIEVKRTIPFLPFLLIAALLVTYTEISFLRQLLYLA